MHTDINDDTHAVALEVANDLFELETAIDAAMSRLGMLITRLPEARRISGAPASLGQTAFTNLSAAMHHLTDARSSVIDVHADLNRVQKRIGLDITGTGAAWKIDRASIAVVSERQAA